MRCVIAVAVALLLFCAAPPVFAAESRADGMFSEEISSLLDSLPTEVREELGILDSDTATIGTIRERFRFGTFFSDIIASLRQAWPSSARLFLHLFGWILLAGVFSQIRTAYVSPSLISAFDFFTSLLFALTLSDSVGSLLGEAQSYLQILTSVSTALAPAATAILAASGQLTFAAVTNAALMLLFSLFQSIGGLFLVPIVRVSYCLGIVGAVSTDTRTENIAKCVRRVFAVVMSFLMLAVTFVVGVQSILAKSADSFSSRTVKFALGNMIPLIGSALAEAVSTVSTSLSLIRSAVGGIGVFALLLFLLPTVIRLLLHRLVLSVCGGVADMIGCTAQAKLIGEINSTLGYILAVVCMTGALFLFVLSLFVLIGGNV